MFANVTCGDSSEYTKNYHSDSSLDIRRRMNGDKTRKRKAKYEMKQKQQPQRKLQPTSVCPETTTYTASQADDPTSWDSATYSALTDGENTNHDSNNHPTILTANNIRIFNNSESGTSAAMRDSIFELNNCESHMLAFYDYSNHKRFSGQVAIENVTFSTNDNIDLLKANIYIYWTINYQCNCKLYI